MRVYLSFLLGLVVLASVLAWSDADRAHRAAALVLGSGWSLSEVVSGTYTRPEESRRKPKVERVANKQAKRTKKSEAQLAQAKRGKKRDLAAGYRTLCVRLCDGYYYPISAAAVPGEFQRDEATCRASCASPAKLFVYQNKGGSSDTMTDLTGVPYEALATAYQYRVSYDASCTCTQAPWTEAAAAKQRLYALNEAAASGDLAADLARVPLASAIRADETAARTRSGADLVVASVPHLKAISSVQRSLTKKVAERTRVAMRKVPIVRTAAVQQERARTKRNVAQAAAAAPRRVRVVQRARPIRVSDSRSVVWVQR